MNWNALAFVVVAATLATSPAGAVADPLQEEKAEEAVVIKPQTNCPVMGGKIDPALFVDLQGKRIYVCCKGCIPAVQKDPAKYIKKLEEDGVTVAQLQTKCPVMGGKINPALFVDVQGKRIYVCCKGCIPAIQKDPAKYIDGLQATGTVLEDAPKAD